VPDARVRGGAAFVIAVVFGWAWVPTALVRFPGTDAVPCLASAAALVEAVAARGVSSAPACVVVF
jgi:hypothetical protein